MSEPMTHEEILATTLDTPIGPLSVLAWGDQLVGGGFTERPDDLHARLHRSLRSRPLAGVPADDLAWLAKPVRDYFAGDLRALDSIPTRQPGTPGRQALWAALRAIPPGHTVSYSELAALAGCPHAPRAAGAACAANLIAPVVPCHRAVRTDGSRSGYYYGLDRKDWLLRHEGARPGFA
jgi:methylated-DNA-[protein]-cysteine S-methyltransferase